MPDGSSLSTVDLSIFEQSPVQVIDSAVGVSLSITLTYKIQILYTSA